VKEHPTLAVRLHNVTKAYGEGVIALDRIDLEIPPGMYGLLGANGAGKTTLMRILAGILLPTAGEIRVGPYDLGTERGRRAVQRSLGYLPQELGVYPDLSARQFLDYIGILKGMRHQARRRQRVDEVLDLVSLTDAADRKLGGYSGGMKRRVGISQALLNDPALMVVDEPTVGLDPEERVRFRMLLASLGTQRTILLSTHIIEDVASTCRLAAVMVRGRVLYQGEIQALAQEAVGQVWTVRTRQPITDIEVGTVVSATHHGDHTAYRVVSEVAPRPDATPAEPGLEDGYLALVAGHRRVGAALVN
jgi:ABC-2 type transport system ATP-binding protein